jgi:hypothetical protein
VPLGFAKSLGKQNQGLAVYHRPVPLAHDLEIRGAFAEWRTGAPAIGLQKVGRRGEYVGHAMPQVNASVAVIVDAIFDVGGWQKLRLADLARVGADQIA